MNNRTFGDGIYVGGLTGLLTGLLAAAGVALAGTIGFKMRTFIEDGKPAVMRVYRIGADQILVENPELKGEYRHLYQHLLTIEDIADRELEEARIKKQVKWYEE